MSDFPILVTYHKRPRWYWWVIIIGAPLALSFGTVGFWLNDQKPPGFAPWLDALYHSVQLFILHMPHTPGPVNWCLELGRWLAAGIFGMTALIALYRILATEVQHFGLGFAKDHIVICGLGSKVLQLARCFGDQARAQRVVIAAASATPEEVAACQSAGATLVVGDATRTATLAKARVHRASQLIALCGDDSANVRIALEARKHVLGRTTPARPHTLHCHVHLADVDLRALLQRSSMFPGGDHRYEVRFFDLFDTAARRLLLEPGQLPLDHGGILEKDDRQVHLVILGFGRMGRSVALRAAQLGHFANLKPIRISVVDRDAGRREHALLFRYPSFPKVCSVEFQQIEVESRRVLELLDVWCADQHSVTSIAVCFDQDSLALEVALRLLPRLRECRIPIAVRMSREDGFAALLQEKAATPDFHFYVRGFGLMEDELCTDLFREPPNETLARAIHEDFREERKHEPRDPARDRSLLPWEELDDDFKDSNRQQADHISIKLHGIGCEPAGKNRDVDPRPPVNEFTPHEVALIAEMEHNRWNAERLLAGWTLGPSDKANKVSPYIVPWALLPPNIQEYDRRTVRLIPKFLDKIGEKVCRKQPLA
jgi:hypothetical protein